MRISAFTVITEPEKMGYPYLESIKSFSEFCDEVIIVAGRKEQKSEELIRRVNNVRFINTNSWPVDWHYDHMRDHFNIGLLNSKGDFSFKFDVDHIFDKRCIENLRSILDTCYENTHIIRLRSYNIMQKDRGYIKNYTGTFIVNRFLLNRNGIDYGFSNESGSNQVVAKKAELLEKRVSLYIFNYSDFFMTKQQIIEKTKRWHKAFFRKTGRENVNYANLDDESIFKRYSDYFAARLAQARTIDINIHPEIIRERVMNVENDKWGYSNFGLTPQFPSGKVKTWLQKIGKRIFIERL